MSDATHHGFKTDLDVRWRSRRTWELLAPLVYVSREGTRFVVEQGFVTDFASIPRLARWLVVRDSELARAATLHDMLSRKRGFDQRVADELFKEAALPDVGRRARARIAYAGARAGSWWRWLRTGSAKVRVEGDAHAPRIQT